LGRVEHRFAVGEDAHLEVAAAVALRAEAGAREVRAPEIEETAVDRDHLEVDARALPHLDPARELREPRELLRERTRRRRCM